MRLHGDDEVGQTWMHTVNDWAADLVLIGVPVLLIVLLGVILYRAQLPPKGKHHAA